jgi:hypothetical protein
LLLLAVVGKAAAAAAAAMTGDEDGEDPSPAPAGAAASPTAAVAALPSVLGLLLPVLLLLLLLLPLTPAATAVDELRGQGDCDVDVTRAAVTGPSSPDAPEEDISKVMPSKGSVASTWQHCLGVKWGRW